MLKRFRVWLARWLTRGTECCVVRSNRLESLGKETEDLDRYVTSSGGLQDPRRVRAYHVLLRITGNVRHAMKDMAA